MPCCTSVGHWVEAAHDALPGAAGRTPTHNQDSGATVASLSRLPESNAAWLVLATPATYAAILPTSYSTTTFSYVYSPPSGPSNSPAFPSSLPPLPLLIRLIFFFWDRICCLNISMLQFPDCWVYTCKCLIQLLRRAHITLYRLVSQRLSVILSVGVFVLNDQSPQATKMWYHWCKTRLFQKGFDSYTTRHFFATLPVYHLNT